ncbi:ORF6N domain-containing protein [Flavobacterium limnophilum]|uniref:ORF6N domain-containing protein n=1 Tax=Flavobacterium limnophilum TaxID=3003262 RepID=UPI0022ABDF81|nr:ORF6N domain-containing protein [Flavobacterium limnophilum]
MDGIIIPNEIIENKIYLIRNTKVMLDRDLAILFDVKPYRLREQVSRNLDKFPEHFMFRLNEVETQIMISQNAIPSKQALGGSLPYVFTEHGILQLSNVVKSEKATQISIKIIEIFVNMREFLSNNLSSKIDIEEIKRRLDNNDKNVELLFSYLDEMMDKNENKIERIKIGYKK